MENVRNGADSGGGSDRLAPLGWFRDAVQWRQPPSCIFGILLDLLEDSMRIPWDSLEIFQDSLRCSGILEDEWGFFEMFGDSLEILSIFSKLLCRYFEDSLKIL